MSPNRITRNRREVANRLNPVVIRSVLFAVAAAGLLSACGTGASLTTGQPAATTSARPVERTSTTTSAAAYRQISYQGVGLLLPASWPLLDGAHAAHRCGSTFYRQADRAFLGPTYWGAPSCPARAPGTSPPSADGVWMRPGGQDPPVEPATTLPARQVVYLAENPASSDVTVWYHGVSIDIGIGPDPAVEQAILNSISYHPDAGDTPVLGRCPAPDPAEPPMPTPARVTTPFTTYGDVGLMAPEPASVEPDISAASVWDNFFHGDLGSGPIGWKIYFGSYSAPTPATINPDGSTTPLYPGGACLADRRPGLPDRVRRMWSNRCGPV